MKFLSVCSGIEAATVAWTPLGWKAIGFSEIEPFPAAVLKYHYPDVINFGDMTALPDMIRMGLIELPDLLCGGTPCQAFSVAGLRKSLEDERGNLSLVFCEIANVIDEERKATGAEPSIIFWENVPGVLNTKDNAFGCFLAGLAGETVPLEPAGGKWTNAGAVLGPKRAVAWRVLDAQYFGVAQRRRRVFVVASAREGFDPTAILFEREGVRRDTPPSRETRQNTAGTISSRAADGSGLGSAFECDGRSGPIGFDAYQHHGWRESETIGTLTANLARGICGDSPLAAYSIQGSMIGRNDNAVEPMHDVAPCLTKTDVHGVAQPMAFNIAPGKGELKDDIHVTDAHISKTIDASGSNPSMHQGGAAIVQTMAVRRLTPVECERLQGFPDNYTNIPWRKADESPDAPRYKALGNSWAVPNVRWIGQRIKQHLMGAL